jgi:hypothetical protein
MSMEKIARLGMSPRQQALNHYWSWYRVANYDARRIDWDGRERAQSSIDHEAIAHAGFIPPGFYDAGATFPLKFRRPTAPYALVKVIVDRFTGLLFSEGRHPQVRSPGDPLTEDYVGAMAEASRLWQAMIRARTFGGATGSVAVGFQFLNGRPVVEVHDPRWLRPEFVDRATHKLKAIEKRFMFPVELQDPETGAWVPVPHWYRRVVTDETDTLWKPVPVGEGEEPDWDDPNLVEAHVEHGLGECPVVWVQNLPVEDDVDGDPDCHGVYDMVEMADALIAQANRGIIANSDPTVLIVSPDNLPEVRKGNENAIKLTQGDAKYMEANLEGPRSALEMAEGLRKKILEVAQCVLDHPERTSVRTATEIKLVYSSMTAKADVLREQYGERCVKPLMEMMVRAAQRVTTRSSVDEDGTIVKHTLSLPDRAVTGDDGTVHLEPRRLGHGGTGLKLQWPDYFEASLQDIDLATRAAGAAKQLGLVDSEHAVKKVAQYYDVEDVPAMLRHIKQEAQEQVDELAARSLSGLSGAEPPAPPISAQEPREEEEPRLQ